MNLHYILTYASREWDFCPTFLEKQGRCPRFSGTAPVLVLPRWPTGRASHPELMLTEGSVLLTVTSFHCWLTDDLWDKQNAVRIFRFMQPEDPCHILVKGGFTAYIIQLY